MTSNECDKIFLAGVFSVRATIRLSKWAGPGIRIFLEDRGIADRAQEVFGCGSVATVPKRNSEGDEYLWRWEVAGDDALDVLEEIAPLLRGKNGDRARLALERYKRVA
jgi:hypothetical protein